MNHDFRLDVLRDFSKRGGIPHVCFEEFAISYCGNFFKVEPFTTGSVKIVEVVYDGQSSTAANQRLSKMRPNKTCPACQ